MLTKKLLDLASTALQRTYTYYLIGKDIFEYSNKSIQRHLSNEEAQAPYEPTLKEDEAEFRRESLKRNMEMPEPNDSFIQSKQQSMMASQGVADHSGSSYHGSGRPGEKINSNMWQRNFDNHQGN